MMAILGPSVLRRRYDLAAWRRGVRAPQDACCFDGASTIVMAGDTHDLEYYAEPSGDGAGRAPLRQRRRRRLSELRHCSRLAARAATAEWAYYPDTPPSRRRSSADALVEAPGVVVDAGFRRLAVLSGMALGAFDYNVAPFFQSFVEVRVEAIREPGARDSLRRARAIEVGGSRLLRALAYVGRGGRERARRMGLPDGARGT